MRHVHMYIVLLKGMYIVDLRYVHSPDIKRYVHSLKGQGTIRFTYIHL